MIKELSQDAQLWEIYLAEADEYYRTGKMPTHRNAKERALLLTCVAGG